MRQRADTVIVQSWTLHHDPRDGPAAAQHSGSIPADRHRSGPLRDALGHASDLGRGPGLGATAHPRARRERRRLGRGAVYRARRRAQEDAPQRRRRPAVRRRRGLWRLRHHARCVAWVDVLRVASARAGIPPAVRHPLGHDRGPGPGHLRRGQLRAVRPGGCPAGLDRGRGPRLRRVLLIANEIHRDRRPSAATEGRSSRDRRHRLSTTRPTTPRRTRSTRSPPGRSRSSATSRPHSSRPSGRTHPEA